MPLPAIWGSSLWDSYNPQLYTFTKYNQEFLRQYTEFLERRAKVEKQYAKDVRKLCKEFTPKDYDRKEKIKFALQSSFEAMLKELEAQANQHDTLAENLSESSKALKDSLKELQRQFALTEKKIAGLIRDLDKVRSLLDAARSQYQRSHTDMRKAKDDYNANKDNRDITQNEIQRFKMVYEQKQNIFEDKKICFAKELSDYNGAQRRYFTEQLPEQLLTLQQLEESLVDTCRQHFLRWSDSELDTLKMQTKCAADMRERIGLVNAEADVREFLRLTASGNEVPADLPYEDLGSNDSIATLQGQQQPPVGKASKIGTIKGTKSMVSGPAQQKRRLEDCLRAQDQELDKARKEVDAMQKLLTTFKQNPKQAATIQQQIQQVTEKIARLTQERAETAKELESLGGVVIPNLTASFTAPSAAPAATPTPAAQQHVGAFDDEFDSPTSPPRPTPISGGGAANSPAPAPAPAPAAASARTPSPGPALPLVAMLYEFNDPSQPDNLAVQAGERLHLLQRDTDWSLVRRTVGNTAEQGYVPTAYMADV